MRPNHLNKLKYLSIAIVFTLLSCNSWNRPLQPLVSLDDTGLKLFLIQTDTTAHDTAIVSLNNKLNKRVIIKDSIKLNLLELIKEVSAVECAYNLCLNNNLIVNVKTQRGLDTTLNIKWHHINIEPVKIAKVLTGECIGFRDGNDSTRYIKSIRKWLFENGLSPDSTVIAKMSYYIRQFNYTGKEEFTKLDGEIPIISSIENESFRFNTELEAQHFYLIAFQKGKEILPFIKEKVLMGLSDSNSSTEKPFRCSNKPKQGLNILSIVGIDNNGEYKIQPVGLVIIDKKGPIIKSAGYMGGSFENMLQYDHVVNELRKDNKPLKTNNQDIIFEKQNIKILVPKNYFNIESFGIISYGNFEGNHNNGYNIPFKIECEGDLKKLIIDGNIISNEQIKNSRFIRVKIRHLDYGDNEIKISAEDKRGNITNSSISIYVRRIRRYYHVEKYNNLESRIEDLESRIEDLE